MQVEVKEWVPVSSAADVIDFPFSRALSLSYMIHFPLSPFLLSPLSLPAMAAWMKCEKVTKAHHILLMTKRFNETSRAVASEILRQPEISKRVSVIEKWAAVADICRCLHNFNGVLQICAAFTNSSVFRLKKTWEKVCKTVSRRS